MQHLTKRGEFIRQQRRQQGLGGHSRRHPTRWGDVTSWIHELSGLEQVSSSAATRLRTEVAASGTVKRGSEAPAGCNNSGRAARDEAEAIRVMHAAIDEGITFFDNAWDYHDGGGEVVMGKALASGAKPDKVFLMTRGCDRDYKGAMRCIDESFKRLQADYLDVWQFHEIVYDNDPDWVFEQDGIRAAIEAREAGKIRHIGFTGHRDPRIHRMMLDKRFDWETVQLPINMMGAQFRSFGRQIVPTLVERGIGVIGMKTLGGGVIPRQAGVSADTCIRHALSQPVSTIAVGMMSMDELQANVS